MRGSDWRKKEESDLREVNRQLQHSHLTTLKAASEVVKGRKSGSFATLVSADPPLDLHDSDHLRDKPSMAMEPRFRNYSSDSVGSDRVFLDDANYQGMRRVMDYRKGRVVFAGSVADSCFYLFHLLFVCGWSCHVTVQLNLFLHVIYYFQRS